MGKHTKWRISRGESLSHKITKPQTFRKFNKVEQGALLLMVMFVGIFAVGYGYYSVNVAPFSPGGSQYTKPDPYTVIWDGQIPTNFNTIANLDCTIQNAPGADYKGYFCNRATIINGELELDPNSTAPGLALSTGSLDLSQCASKACAFANAFLTGAQPLDTTFAWALRANGTLPTEQAYDPILDPSTALLVYCIYQGTSHFNCYVYMQRQSGQAPNSVAGFQSDIYPDCNYASTLFRCMKVTTNTGGVGSNGDNLVLNYTGGNTGAQGASQSYFCGGSVASGVDTCNVGGIGYIADQNQGTISYPGYLFNQTLFPWFNVQNNYHMLYWEAPYSAPNPITFVTGINSIGSIASYYVAPSTTTSPTTDTGGFFGWVGRSLGGAYDAVAGTLSPLISPIINAGNSLMNAFIAGFVQSINLLIQGFRIVLNFIGTRLGFGNIGDFLIQAVQSFANAIIGGFNLLLAGFAIIDAFITGGYFSFITGFVVLAAALLPVAIFLWKIVFNGAFTVTDILFFDYVFGMFLVSKAIKERKSALKAFLGWISLNVFIATFLIEIIHYGFDRVIDPIRKTKQTVDPVG